MIQKRIIPCLLLHKGGLYKTVKFKKPNYIGDPINAIRIFNEKEVDELIFLDIDATTLSKEPNYKLIEDIASECFMPLCYGGGVKNIEQMKRIYSLGVEKISLSSSAVYNPSLIKEASNIFGSQSVVVTVDVKKDFFGKKKVFTHNGKKNSKLNVLDFLIKLRDYGVGEIVINSVDKEGVMGGFDYELLSEARKVMKIPLIALGGAGSLDDIGKVFRETNINAVAAGSVFVYKGALKGVLVNYPNQKEIRRIVDNSFKQS